MSGRKNNKNAPGGGTKRPLPGWDDNTEVSAFFDGLGLHASQQKEAVKCCQEQFVCNVGDLRLVARNPETLKELFPPIGIRVRVQAWYDQEQGLVQAQPSPPPTAAATAKSALTLPAVLNDPNLGKSGKSTASREPPKTVLLSNKGIHISSCLQHLHEMGLLCGLERICHLENHLIPPVYYEKQHVRYLLEVVEQVATREELQRLQEKPKKKTSNDDDSTTTTDALQELYQSLQVRVMDKMWEYEGKDPAKERELQRRKAGSRFTPTYLGFGKRVKKYKKEMLQYLEDCCRENGTELPPKGVNLDLRDRDQWLTKWEEDNLAVVVVETKEPVTTTQTV
jgi:hypothetical protein